MSRVDEYRAQLAAVLAEPAFPGKRKLIAFFRRLIHEELRPTSNLRTSNMALLFSPQTRRSQSRAGMRSTRRRNRNGNR